jgi:hypothetical protein
MNEKTYKVLSIEAWGNETDGYAWNQWFNVGTIALDINAHHAQILERMESEGFITNASLGDIDDDQYNLVIVDKETREPIFAIEYGSEA